MTTSAPFSRGSRWLVACGVALLMLVGGSLIGCSSGESTPASADTATEPSATVDGCDADDGGLALADGFCATVVADTLGPTRHLAVDADGDVYAAVRSADAGGGIVALRDTTGDFKADVVEYFGDTGGTGIGLHKGALYFGPDSGVWRYPFDGDELIPSGEKDVLVTGFPEQDQHAVKPFTFDGTGGMYVNVGAPSNACQVEMRTPGSEGQDPCPQLERHGGIWQFADDVTGQTQTDDGTRYASGIRNAVALDWNAAAGALYVAQHGRDQLHSLWPDLYTQEESAVLPAEEVFKVNEGDDFGWPYCYYDWKYDEQKELAPEYGGDGSTVGRCDAFENPIQTFPGHWAPNDILFYDGDQFPSAYQGGAFIAWHGSWNRAPFPQEGYKVTFTPFDGDRPAGDYEVFADGFSGADSLASPGDAAYRPTGLAIGPDGALYVADDAQGRIWRIAYVGTEPETSDATTQ